MRESQQYVIKKLNELFSSIQGIKIRYEFRDYLSAHLIEVLPCKVFEDDHDYLLAEMSFQDGFEKRFGTNEEILFISSDSLNEIKESQYSLGYEVIEIIEKTPVFTHSYRTFGLGLEVNQEDTSYALAA